MTRPPRLTPLINLQHPPPAKYLDRISDLNAGAKTRHCVQSHDFRAERVH